jgi:DNA-binding XRE family transcriptional regulator
MSTASETQRVSPIGETSEQGASRRRARRAYRDAAAEYAAIAELRKVNPLAAHLRERRFELGLTQSEVADAAGTSHTYISGLETGKRMPTIPVLIRVLAVLDEELRLVFERSTDGEADREEIRMSGELLPA